MRGVCGLEPVPARQGGREFGGGPIDRAQVQPGQQGGEDADLVDGTVAQRPAEDLREQQDRTKARRCRRSRGLEEGSNLLTQRMAGHSGVDEYIGIEGVHYRVSRPALIAAISSSARCAVSPGPSGNGSAAAWVSNS